MLFNWFARPQAGGPAWATVAPEPGKNFRVITMAFVSFQVLLVCWWDTPLTLLRWVDYEMYLPLSRKLSFSKE